MFGCTGCVEVLDGTPDYVVLLGFGSANQALAKLLLQKDSHIKSKGKEVLVSGIFTRTHGGIWTTSAKGLNLESALSNCDDLGKTESNDSTGFKTGYSMDIKQTEEKMIAAMEQLKDHGRLSVLAEAIIANYENGEPAAAFARFALGKGIHYCTANKAPVALFYDELCELATANNCRFRFESACGDGIPIFNLTRYCLPATNITKFEGILNSTTNVILNDMEKHNKTVEEGIKTAQDLGIAEADPSGDVNGYDAAVKCLCLARMMMKQHCDKSLTIQDIPKASLYGTSPEEIQALAAKKQRIKFLCSGEVVGDNKVELSVKKEIVDESSPFYSVNGTDNIWTFHYDILCSLTLIQHDGSTRDTGFGLLADILDVIGYHEHH